MTWTDNERALLRHLATDIGWCIADPDDAIDSMEAGHRSGCGHGFAWRFTETAIVGEWHEWIPVAWAEAGGRRPEGEPIRWRTGALLRKARVSYPRLRQWCESLPVAVRAHALTWWAMYPEVTRNLPALQRLTLAQLAEPEPADLLELLEAGS